MSDENEDIESFIRGTKSNKDGRKGASADDSF